MAPKEEEVASEAFTSVSHHSASSTSFGDAVVGENEKEAG